MSALPRSSPCGAVQKCEELCEGVFQVSTAGHGGIMVRYAASEFLSSEALKCAFRENRSFCFEEDCGAQVVLRELLDKNMWKIPDRITDKAEYENRINQSLQRWNPEYWKARQKSLSLQTVRIENKNVISAGKIKITNEEMLIDTAKNNFDMQEIRNSRFMYNPQTGTLILGRHYAGNKLLASHAEEHGYLKVKEPFDSFIRGWVGTGGQYTSGVIHFAPPIPKDNPELFDKGFSTLELFALNGAVNQIVIRGFAGIWEQPLECIIKCESAERVPNQVEKKPPTLAKRLEAGKAKAAAQNTARETADTPSKKKGETEH